MPIPSPLAFQPTALRNVAAGLVVGNPIGSGGTRAKALTAAELKAIVEASGIGYLPLSGGTLTGALSLGSNALTCGAIAASGTIVTSNAVSGQTVGIEIGNGILGGVSNHDYIRLKTNWGDVGFKSWSGVLAIYGAGVSCLATPNISADSSGSIGFSSGTYVASPDSLWYRGGPGIIQQRNGLNAQSYLLQKSYTSNTNQEALLLDAGKQISGKLGLYSYRGSSGGSNYPIQIGMLASNGTTFSGLTVGTDGVISTAWDNGGTQAINCGNNIGLTQFGQHFLLGNKFGGATYYYVDVDANTGNLRLPSVGCFGITSGNAYSGTMDVTLSRNAAGIFQIGTTAANASGSLLVTNLTASGVTKIILPTSDPHILGCLWNNSGTITISAG